ncbi:MAG: arsenite methyltransferase [Phycisphaerales bacterium]|nr:arsenite methyltransferase [Phycisphaerales bacterium]
MSTNEAIRDQIRSDYSTIATTSNKAEGTGSCCCAGACGVTESIDPDVLAEQIGYSREELEALPADANMGLSCGNPNVIANLREGETVLDLGSGGGFDLFLAGPKVGKTGKAIGVDMTAEMIGKARKNLEHYTETTGLDNVEFRLGEIEHLPVADNSVDVVMSNCVINLALDKQGVWNEIARVLKPGGRVAISDMALFKPLPESVKGIVESWAGCIAGAALIEELRDQMFNAGLQGVTITPKPEYVRALMNADDPLYKKVVAELPEGESAADYITSVDIAAVNPDGACCGTGCC